MGVLFSLLKQSSEVLSSGGRLAVITFHSIEDRMVKQFLKGELDQEVDPVFGSRVQSPFELWNKKPIEPSHEEVVRNPRSRSARLRVGIRR
jgi:16S rRNA (cytosine1402-N4)-methyltransferase